MLKHFFPTLSSWMQEPTYYSSPRGYYLRVCGLPTWKSQVHFLRQVIEVRIQDRSKACPPYVIRDSKNLSMTAENFSKKKKGIKTARFLLKWSIKQQLFERNSHLHFGTIHSVVVSPAAAEGPCNHQWSQSETL